MKRLTLAALLLSSILFANVGAAAGLYLGAGIGQAGIKDNINTENFDENDAAYKVFLGWRSKVLPVFDVAFEAAYTDFGKPSQTLGGQRVETNINGPSIAGLAILPLGPFDLYGKLGGMEQRGNSQVIRAQVPLSEMFGYATDLRSRTQGRATYTIQFDSYQQMPSNVQEEIVTRIRGE